jgi:hypothetical protein
VAQASKPAKMTDVAEARMPGHDFGIAEEIEMGIDAYDLCLIVPGWSYHGDDPLHNTPGHIASGHDHGRGLHDEIHNRLRGDALSGVCPM